MFVNDIITRTLYHWWIIKVLLPVLFRRQLTTSSRTLLDFISESMIWWGLQWRPISSWNWPQICQHRPRVPFNNPPLPIAEKIIPIQLQNTIVRWKMVHTSKLKPIQIKWNLPRASFQPEKAKFSIENFVMSNSFLNKPVSQNSLIITDLGILLRCHPYS